MEPIWEIIFYPGRGEKDSPYDYILKLADKNEQAQINHRLEFFRNNEISDWPHLWYHKLVDKIFQLRANNSRIMYFLDSKSKKIVLIHACKKVGQKARSEDIKRAIKHYKDYISENEV
jgi:phage-related protein